MLPGIFLHEYIFICLSRHEINSSFSLLLLLVTNLILNSFPFRFWEPSVPPHCGTCKLVQEDCVQCTRRSRTGSKCDMCSCFYCFSIFVTTTFTWATNTESSWTRPICHTALTTTTTTTKFLKLWCVGEYADGSVTWILNTHTTHTNSLLTQPKEYACLHWSPCEWIQKWSTLACVYLANLVEFVCLFVSKLMVYPWTPSKQNLIIIVQWTNKQTTNKRSEFPYTQDFRPCPSGTHKNGVTVSVPFPLGNSASTTTAAASTLPSIRQLWILILNWWRVVVVEDSESEGKMITIVSANLSPRDPRAQKV